MAHKQNKQFNTWNITKVEDSKFEVKESGCVSALWRTVELDIG